VKILQKVLGGLLLTHIVCCGSERRMTQTSSEIVDWRRSFWYKTVHV